jgi:chromosome segregation ATPase
MEVEAAREREKMADLRRKIGARRDLLAGQDLFTPQVKKLQQFVDSTLKRLDQNKAKNEERLQKVFKEVADAAPDMEKLPANQKEVARRMDEAKEALNKARADYNAKLDQANAKTDQVIKEWTERLATQQARIDDRRQQLERQAKGAGAANQNTAEDRQAKAARLQKLRDALVLSLKSEQAALDEYHDAYGRYTDAQTRQHMAEQAASPVQDQKQWEELRARHDEAETRARALDEKARAAAELAPPTYNDVQQVSGFDLRVPAISGIAAVAALACLVTLKLTRDNVGAGAGEPGSFPHPLHPDAADLLASEDFTLPVEDDAAEVGHAQPAGAPPPPPKPGEEAVVV